MDAPATATESQHSYHPLYYPSASIQTPTTTSTNPTIKTSLDTSSATTAARPTLKTKAHSFTPPPFPRLPSPLHPRPPRFPRRHHQIHRFSTRTTLTTFPSGCLSSPTYTTHNSSITTGSFPPRAGAACKRNHSHRWFLLPTLRHLRGLGPLAKCRPRTARLGRETQLPEAMGTSHLTTPTSLARL